MQLCSSSDTVVLGTLLSREQFLADVKEWGFRDGRLPPNENMIADEIARWIDAIGT